MSNAAYVYARLNEVKRENERLRAENQRLHKLAYLTIPLPRGFRWLSRFSAR